MKSTLNAERKDGFILLMCLLTLALFFTIIVMS